MLQATNLGLATRSPKVTASIPKCPKTVILFGNHCYVFSSIAWSCPTVCDPMDCNMPGFPVHHQALETAQTYIHRVSDAVQPSHPLSSPSPLTFNLSQHQAFSNKGQFFASGGQSIGISTSASVLLMNIQDWFPLGWNSWISLQSKGLSRVFSNTTVQKHQFFGTQFSLWSNSHIHTWLLEKPQLWLDGPLLAVTQLFDPNIVATTGGVRVMSPT